MKANINKWSIKRKKRELAAIYEEYQGQMERGGFYDYEDMIMETALVMEK